MAEFWSRTFGDNLQIMKKEKSKAKNEIIISEAQTETLFFLLVKRSHFIINDVSPFVTKEDAADADDADDEHDFRSMRDGLYQQGPQSSR